jgi:DNA-binding MarR family transcriptional regulator
MALTAAGRSLLARATPVWERTHAEIEDRLARGEPDLLRGSLRALS